jgi:hypothetical protein
MFLLAFASGLVNNIKILLEVWNHCLWSVVKLYIGTNYNRILEASGTFCQFESGDTPKPHLAVIFP